MVISNPGKAVDGLSSLCSLLPVKSGWSSLPTSVLMQRKVIKKRPSLRVCCQQVEVPRQQLGVEEQEEDVGIICEHCNGQGWLACDFCEGQKINVKAANGRLYRRCPSCKAVGYLLCQKCKVFKCVTFPDYGDGEL